MDIFFSVDAVSDIIITLFGDWQTEENGLDIILGGWSGEHTLIRANHWENPPRAELTHTVEQFNEV